MYRKSILYGHWQKHSGTKLLKKTIFKQCRSARPLQLGLFIKVKSPCKIRGHKKEDKKFEKSAFLFAIGFISLSGLLANHSNNFRKEKILFAFGNKMRKETNDEIEHNNKTYTNQDTLNWHHIFYHQRMVMRCFNLQDQLEIML